MHSPSGKGAGRRGALEGLRIVELGQGVSAPFCAKLLADYGAEVIKVELPGEGDVARSWGPFPGDEPHPEKSGLFFSLNTNKRGVTLDPGSEQGRELLIRLLEHADVFIENYPPAQMREWGLDYASLQALYPELLMISITPFGQTGPYADWKGCDLNAFHLSAAGSRYCGRPDEAPLEQGTFAADYFGGYVAATWGLASLFVEGEDRAEHIDVSCAEAIAAIFVGSQNIGLYAQDGIFGRRSGIGLPLAAPATILPCKDGYVWMIALEVGQWRGLVRAMGNPDWAAPEIFDDMTVRAQNADFIYPMIKEWTAELTKQEIMDLCQANAVPSTAVYTVKDIAELPHMADRDFFADLDHPLMGRVRTLGAPVLLPESPAGPRSAAPLLGEHNDEILTEELRRAPLATAEHAKPTSTPTPALPLAGLRVANFGWGWLGPVAGQTLSRLGAEVYKIESRVRVDINRTIPPFATGREQDPDCSLQNHAGWSGNGSITVNLKKPEGQALAREVVGKCDVVLENFGPGVMNKLGLGYEALCAVKPDVVMVSMPAAGVFGAMSDVRTYGMSLGAITGLESTTGYHGEDPVPMENAFADPLGGVIGAFAALLGVHYRKRSGSGQHVDFSQQEGVMQLVAPAFMDFFMNGRVAAPIGNRHPTAAAAPHGVFPCAGEDRWISLAVHDDSEWRGLLEAMEHPGWARSAGYANREGRVANIEALHAELARWTSGFDDYALAERLQGLGVAAAPVLNVADLLSDPHYKARQTFIEIEHPLGFKETVYGNYVKTARARPAYAPGPAMGQDNQHVYRDLLGIPEARYRELIEQEVIV
ncbi:MAG: CoA transferase [Deltaproteobacteria bacterium]|nr:CoA transferase [Deltaproteobacteria bacterium]